VLGVPGPRAEDAGWQLATDLIEAWRGAEAGRAQDAVAQRLTEAADRGAAPEQAVFGLTALANMFAELYADCACSSVEVVLLEAAALKFDTGP
jgi:hypothetical protein